MVTTGYESITVSPDVAWDAYRAAPDTGRGPGIVLLPEVTGLNDHMRALADELAGHRYLVLVPDLFWRLRHRFEGTDSSGMAEGATLARRLDRNEAVTDLTATLAHLRAMPGCTGGVGVVGFCVGGTLAYLCGTSVRVDGRGPDAVVSYYGSGVPDLLDRADSLDCPAMFHVGDRDPYLPADGIAAVEAAVANRPDVAVHHYDAGHAFANPDAPSSHDPEPADIAWGRTRTFLDDVVP
ncbi:dienelactone hydrolase family protein [Saccharomonospora halophila]|uniref:dienelactone hydrolase family protein n=1 Tax=Saccharomonospora halophila TaxID=129922 RepID=UPI00036FDE47|nr:dienelactone hydrolase family protein [Saccharomonospora halophila]